MVKQGKRTLGGVSAGLPGIYLAEILGFATLRPSVLVPVREAATTLTLISTTTWDTWNTKRPKNA